MNLEQITRLWHKIAVVCFIFTALMVMASNLMEQAGKNECRPQSFVDPRVDSNSKLLAALFLSGFMVFFFHNIRTSGFIKKTNELLESLAEVDIRIISDRIPVTYLHVSFYFPIFMFCLVTFAAPILAAILLYLNSVRCHP